MLSAADCVGFRACKSSDAHEAVTVAMLVGYR